MLKGIALKYQRKGHIKATEMVQKDTASTAIRLTQTAISTALVSVATIIFYIYVPATRGFFNVGETMIFLAALLFGPVTGAFAGGVGASLADVLLNYWYYAPATLVIKACEGAIVGILGRRRPKADSRRVWMLFTLIMGLVIQALVALIGAAYLSGTTELHIGIPPPENANVIFFVPREMWFVLGGLVGLLVSLTGLLAEPEVGWLVFTTLTGGAVMVAGYFVYEQFLLFPLFGITGVFAPAEIPINIGQMLVGVLVAIPIVKILSRSLPQLKR
jgi:uncharacterized membrane protein